MRVEEERQPLAERVDVEAGVDGGLHVGDGVGERERHFLDRRRARLADVIAADRDRVPLRHVALAEREDVGDDAERRFRRVDVGAARDVLLQHVVLHGAGERRWRHALLLRDGDVQRQQDDRGRVDRHRRRHAIERDAVEQRRHVLDRIDRHADAPDFAGRQRVVRVVADLRRQIEGDAQAADALRQQVAVAAVRLRGGPKACVLPHRPQPAAIHRRLDAAGEWKLARIREIAFGVEAGQVFWADVIALRLRRVHGAIVVWSAPRRLPSPSGPSCPICAALTHLSPQLIAFFLDTPGWAFLKWHSSPVLSPTKC